MKKRALRFDRFLVFIFSFNKGERKNFSSQEITRGLTDRGPQTLSTIPVFTKGSFHAITPGLEPRLALPGAGGAETVAGDSTIGHGVVALEDDSEYHCIVPREHTPKFWNRNLLVVEGGDSFYLLPGEYAYVASGKLATVSEKLIYNSDVHGRYYIAEEKTILAILSRHD